MSAVEIAAEIRIRRSQLASDVKAAQKEIQDAFAKSSVKAGLTVPLEVDSKGLQAKLNAAIAKLTITPITIPVQFAPGSGVPAGGGGGGGYPSPGPYARAGLAGAWAAGIPLGGPGYNISPGSGGGGSGGGGGGWGGGGGMYGLRRYIGAGFLLNEGLRVANMYDTYQSQMTRANMTNDLRGQYQAEETLQQSLTSIPLVGHAAGYLANKFGNKSGIDKEFTEAELQDRGASAASAANRLTRTLNSRGAQATMSEEERRKANQPLAEQDTEAAIGEMIKGLPANLRPNTQVIRDALKKQQSGEDLRAYLLQTEQLHSMSNERDERAARMSGDTDLSEQISLEAKQEATYNSLKRKDPALAKKYKESVMPGETAELEDTQRRGREKDAGDSAAHISDIEAAAAEKTLQARGEAFNAALAASKRFTDDRVAQLEREAKAERDTVRKGTLEREAAAERRAGVADQEAMKTAHARETARTLRGSESELGAAQLAASGQAKASRDQAIDDHYNEEVRRIQEANDPDKQQQLQAALNRRNARKATAARQDAVERRSLGISTADAEARAKGQAGVGEVEEMIAHFRDLESNATTDQDAQAVRRYEKAQIEAYKRAHKPQAGRSYDLMGYKDALQDSITNGATYDTAMRNLAAFQGRQGRPTPGAGNPTDQSDRDLKDAAKNLNEAAKKINDAQTVGIIRRRG